jgi:hypothetical protein
MRLLRPLVGVLLVLAACGCTGYRLGPTNPAATEGRTIQVRFFENQTLEPRLVESVNRALRRVLQQDGSLKVRSHGTADLLLSGVIVSYDRLPLAFVPRDVATVKDYEIRLRAKVTAVERLSGKKLLDREVSGRTTVRVGSDLASAERQGIPLLAEDLAKNITALLVEGAW